MEFRHLTQRELAERGRLSGATLERWRGEGLGPQYLKLHGRVLYRIADVEAYEEQCLRSSTVEAINMGPRLVKDPAS